MMKAHFYTIRKLSMIKRHQINMNLWVLRQASGLPGQKKTRKQITGMQMQAEMTLTAAMMMTLKQIHCLMRRTGTLWMMVNLNLIHYLIAMEVRRQMMRRRAQMLAYIECCHGCQMYVVQD